MFVDIMILNVGSWKNKYKATAAHDPSALIPSSTIAYAYAYALLALLKQILWLGTHLANPQATERLRKLQYKAVRKITGGYHGSRQDLLQEIAKVEPIQTKIWDMKVRAAARILEKGIQDDLIKQAEDNREKIGGRCWKDHSLTWAAVKGHHYNTCLEQILAATGENGERQIQWGFTRERKELHTLQRGDLGTKDTLQVIWEMRVRELEEDFFFFFFLYSIFAYGLVPWRSPGPRRGPQCPVLRHIEL